MLDNPGASNSRQRMQDILQDLRERICLLEYQPGARLSEAVLAEHYGVSRTPIRTVLTWLEADGLVQARHGAGTFVTDVDMAALTQVYQLRLELMELMSRLQPLTADEALLQSMQGFAQDLKDHASEFDAPAFARLNLRFFLMRLPLIGNQPLRDISERLYYQTARVWISSIDKLDFTSEVAFFANEVADVIAALQIDDVTTALMVQRLHLSMAFHRMQRD
jgi:DNA-binding GntR family transcriptional regulator